VKGRGMLSLRSKVEDNARGLVGVVPAEAGNSFEDGDWKSLRRW
jgi:hypothetical protein